MSHEELTEFLTGNRGRFLDELVSLLAIPSVSTDPAHGDDMQAAAAYVRDRLKELGFSAEIEATPLHPVVYAERIEDPALPTLLVYGHYDVQPPEPLEPWDTEPCTPEVSGGAIRARGASDDKGQFYAHIKGVEAALAVKERLPVNLKFLIEGEEEIGSPNLDGYIEHNLERLSADAVIISDGAMVGPGIPTLTRGLRGLVYVEVNIRTADRDLHSGAYGGAVPNAAHVLSRMIAGLHDGQGRVTVPGFYDRVRELSAEEAEQLRDVPFDGDRFLDQVGAEPGSGEEGRSVSERIWARPSLDVNGIGSGFQGDGSKTVIPATAMAKISCRLVPDQDSAEIMAALKRHLEDLAPAGTHVEVSEFGQAQPALTPDGFPALNAAAAALEQVWGRPPAFARTGGSIPVVNSFQELLGAPVVLLDMGLETDNLHAPNEHFSVECYTNGIHAAALLYSEFRGD